MHKELCVQSAFVLKQEDGMAGSQKLNSFRKHITVVNAISGFSLILLFAMLLVGGWVIAGTSQSVLEPPVTSHDLLLPAYLFGVISGIKFSLLVYFVLTIRRLVMRKREEDSQREITKEDET